MRGSTLADPGDQVDGAPTKAAQVGCRTPGGATLEAEAHRTPTSLVRSESDIGAPQSAAVRQSCEAAARVTEADRNSFSARHTEGAGDEVMLDVDGAAADDLHDRKAQLLWS